jgi:hypothetical protein
MAHAYVEVQTAKRIWLMRTKNAQISLTPSLFVKMRPTSAHEEQRKERAINRRASSTFAIPSSRCE